MRNFKNIVKNLINLFYRIEADFGANWDYYAYPYLFKDYMGAFLATLANCIKHKWFFMRKPLYTLKSIIPKGRIVEGRGPFALWSFSFRRERFFYRRRFGLQGGYDLWIKCERD